MGKRGPAPKPTALRILHGDKKNRINFDEPMAPDGLAQCPPEVAADVRAIWDYTIAQISAMRLATPADRDSLVCYCEAVIQHRKASAVLARSGVLIKGLHGNLVRNPALQIQRDSATLIRAFAQEFGLTPSARSMIKAGERASGGNAERLLS